MENFGPARPGSHPRAHGVGVPNPHGKVIYNSHGERVVVDWSDPVTKWMVDYGQPEMRRIFEVVESRESKNLRERIDRFLTNAMVPVLTLCTRLLYRTRSSIPQKQKTVQGIVSAVRADARTLQHIKQAQKMEEVRELSYLGDNAKGANRIVMNLLEMLDFCEERTEVRCIEDAVISFGGVQDAYRQYVKTSAK